MGTPYDLIFDKFIKKLKNDDGIFSYKDLTEEQIEEMVESHLISLLGRAIDKIYMFGLPTVDFYNKDDTLQAFNFDLVNQEISLISDIMYLEYLEEDKNKLKAFGLTFKNSELNLFSPANDRKTFLDMIYKIEKTTIANINTYFSRDRLTWEIKSIY